MSTTTKRPNTPTITAIEARILADHNRTLGTDTEQNDTDQVQPLDRLSKAIVFYRRADQFETLAAFLEANPPKSASLRFGGQRDAGDA